MDELKVTIDGKEHIVRIEEEPGTLKVHLEGKVYTVETSLKNEQKDYDLKDAKEDTSENQVRASIPGTIYAVNVKLGDKVKKGQKLLSLMAMKMENQVLSPKKGKVKTISVKKDDRVNKGDLLLELQ